MGWYVTILGFILIQVCATVLGDDYCYIDDTNKWEECEHGCCGRSYENNRRCCSDTDVLVWIIVGSVIGGILLISFIVAIVCCLVFQKGKKGRVINPAPYGQQPTVYTTTTVPQGYGVYPSAPPYPAGPVAPPAYMGAPPPYSQGPSQQNAGGPPQPYPEQNPGVPPSNPPAFPPPQPNQEPNQPGPPPGPAIY